MNEFGKRILSKGKWSHSRLDVVDRWHFKGYVGVLGLLIITLCSCVFLPNRVTDEEILVSVQGKLIVSSEDTKTALNFRWRKSATLDIVDLWGTLGSHRTRIELDENSIQVTLPNGDHLDELETRGWIDSNLGKSVSPAALISWLRLRPFVNEQIENPSYDDNGQLVAFNELGWSISTTERTYKWGIPLPTRLHVEKHPISLDFRIRSWTLAQKSD